MLSHYSYRYVQPRCDDIVMRPNTDLGGTKRPPSSLEVDPSKRKKQESKKQAAKREK